MPTSSGGRLGRRTQSARRSTPLSRNAATAATSRRTRPPVAAPPSEPALRQRTRRPSKAPTSRGDEAAVEPGNASPRPKQSRRAAPRGPLPWPASGGGWRGQQRRFAPVGTPRRAAEAWPSCAETPLGAPRGVAGQPRSRVSGAGGCEATGPVERDHHPTARQRGGVEVGQRLRGRAETARSGTNPETGSARAS